MHAVILRHAATQGNREKRYIGATDQPLSPEGRAEAMRLGADVSVARVHASPLVRARETARIWYPRAEIIAHAGLMEMDFGAFEGKTYRDMEGDAAYRAWVDGGCEGACPGGEDKRGFTRRVRAAFEGIVEEAIERADERLVIVAHGGTIMAALSEFSDVARPYFDWRADPCFGYRLVIEPGTWAQARRLSVTGPCAGGRGGDNADDKTSGH